MALDKGKLKDDIKAAFVAAASTTDPAQRDAALDAIADAITNAIETYVSNADVQVTAQVGEIAVQGTPAAQTNSAPIVLRGVLQ
jgi:hypothetical protein